MKKLIPLLISGHSSVTLPVKARFGLLSLLLSGLCITQQVQAADINLRPIGFQQIPGWTDDQVADALPALEKTCGVYLKRSVNRAIGKVAGKAGDWHAPCRNVPKKASHDKARAYFEQWFTPYLVKHKSTALGKFTGYYQASVNASRTKSAKYKYPIYAKPNDIISIDAAKLHPQWKNHKISGRLQDKNLTTYYTRAQIDNGALEGIGKEIVWSDNLADVYFLHIQGSGVVHLDDGTKTYLRFAAKNGHKYTSIGTELIKDGYMEAKNTNMQTIRKWMKDYPTKAPELLGRNKSYIFFVEVSEGAPRGAMGVPLTDGRSLAVDKRFIPYGVPLWLDVQANDRLPFSVRRLMLAQDTGSAIKGAIRGDVFWGASVEAAEVAGRMNNAGSYAMLLPKTVRVK